MKEEKNPNRKAGLTLCVPGQNSRIEPGNLIVIVKGRPVGRIQCTPMGEVGVKVAQ